MNRFALRAVANIVAGIALGAAAVLGVTLALQRDARAVQPEDVTRFIELVCTAGLIRQA
jgi:hypothetical protein